jgi:hypothetical protein
MLNSLVLEHVDTDVLKPYANNPHKHPKKQIEQIRSSIRANGVARPVIADEKYEILDGEAVWVATMAEGLEAIPVIRVFGLSETQKRQLRIGLNKHPHNADWDVELLRHEVQLILEVETDFDVGEIGMSVGEVDTLLRVGEADPDDEAIPAVSEKAVSRPRDIWNCSDRHRIGCGDCRDDAFVRQVVGTRPVDTCMTDPPFGDGHCSDTETRRKQRSLKLIGCASLAYIRTMPLGTVPMRRCRLPGDSLN